MCLGGVNRDITASGKSHKALCRHPVYLIEHDATNHQLPHLNTKERSGQCPND